MTSDPYHGRSTETTAYFSDLSELYVQYRPTYPRAAIDAITRGLPDGPRVADVGCGTGISTRQLAEAGCDLIGIEPDDAMRRAAERAAAASPNAFRMHFQKGTGEATGLEDESVHAIVCAQAFHWFDAEAALAEFARVLKPGGRLALMWNRISSDDPFSAAYRGVMNEAGALAAGRGRTLRRNDGRAVWASDRFVDARERWFDNAQELDLDGILGRARSASYFPARGPARERFEQRLRNLFMEHARDESETIPLRYDTHLILAERRTEA